ncbi:MAG: hypothetical protein IJ150_07490 [Bacteroidales bacterium]|nr:hypothetical protein [Bacteroidales bacterium]
MKKINKKKLKDTLTAFVAKSNDGDARHIVYDLEDRVVLITLVNCYNYFELWVSFQLGNIFERYSKKNYIHKDVDIMIEDIERLFPQII